MTSYFDSMLKFHSVTLSRWPGSARINNGHDRPPHSPDTRLDINPPWRDVTFALTSLVASHSFPQRGFIAATKNVVILGLGRLSCLLCDTIHKQHSIFTLLRLICCWRWRPKDSMRIGYLERTRIALQGMSWSLSDKGWGGPAVDQEYLHCTFSCRNIEYPCDWARWHSNRRIHSHEGRIFRVSCGHSMRHAAIWRPAAEDTTLGTSLPHSFLDGRLQQSLHSLLYNSHNFIHQKMVDKLKYVQ